MAVGTRKSNKDCRTLLAPGSRKKTASNTTKTVAFQTATPLLLSNVEYEPESPIGTFAPSARSARLKGAKQSIRPAATAVKRQRLQRVQIQPVAQHVDDSSGSTLDISMFTTADTTAEATIPRILVDQAMDQEPGLLEILSQTACNRTQTRSHPQLKLHIDYPPDCYSLSSAQTTAASLATTPPGRWSNVSPDIIRQRRKQKIHRPPDNHLIFQFASSPPSAGGVHLDLGLQQRSSTHAPEFTHNTPATALVIEDSSAPFLHTLSYAGYSKSRGPETYDVKHNFAAHSHIATFPGGVKQVVKVIVPFQGTPLLPPNSVSSADFVSEKSHFPTVDVASGEPARIVWMQSTAHAFILALEEILQSAEDQLRFSPILHYTTSETTVMSSDECAYVTLYAHFDQIRQVRSLLSTIDIAAVSTHTRGSVTPFASTHISLLVLSASGHPLCLI